MTAPLTREEREDINRRATIPQLSIHKQEVRRLLADLERVEKERDEARAALNVAIGSKYISQGDAAVRLAALERVEQERDEWAETARNEMAGRAAAEAHERELVKRAEKAERERDEVKAQLEKIGAQPVSWAVETYWRGRCQAAEATLARIVETLEQWHEWPVRAVQEALAIAKGDEPEIVQANWDL